MEKMNELYFDIMPVRQCDGAYVFWRKAYGWQSVIRRVAISNDKMCYCILFVSPSIFEVVLCDSFQ